MVLSDLRHRAPRRYSSVFEKYSLFGQFSGKIRIVSYQNTGLGQACEKFRQRALSGRIEKRSGFIENQ
jgi:hypothetical protein